MSSRQQGPLDQLRKVSYPEAVCWIGARLADGLEHAHGFGILHNDLKPANVLLTDEGQPMLLDFGVSEDLALRSAVAGAAVGGTLPYMSPEHLRSVRDRQPMTDARSDIYALGLILFEVLTASHPFRIPTGKFEEELPLMLNERSGPPPRMRHLNPSVSPGLEAIIRKCLEPVPERRYQTAADLRDDLDRHRTGFPLRHVRVPSIRERTRKWARRHPKLTSNLSLGLATAILFVLCIAGYSIHESRLARERAEAANLLDRSNAQITLRLFEDDVREGRYLLTARAMEPSAVEAGIARFEAALARYGLPGDDGWENRAEFQALPGDEQQRVRNQLAQSCLLLARGYSLRVRPGTDGEASLKDAIQLNELAVKLTRESAPRAAWDQRAEVLHRLGRNEDAGRAAGKAKDTPLATAEDYFLAGSEAVANRRFQEARKLLRRSLELDPTSFWTHMALGLCHEGLGQLPEAAASYTAAIAVWPNYAGGYHSRGLVALRQRDYPRALADLNRAAEMVPDSADVFLNRALAHQGLREFQEGLADLETALKLGAPRSRALLMRARMRELSGDAAGAKKDLADGMRENPTDELGWIARGVARLGTDLPGAISDFDAALRLNPRSLPAMQNKAHALSRLGRNPDAILVLSGVVKLYPDYIPARAGRGVLNARVGNEKAALEDAKDALSADSSPSNLYQVAGIYALLDQRRPENRPEAIRLLTAALRAGFGHDYIETDADLDPIRDSAEFKRVLDGVRALKLDKDIRR
jgi:tetratricopeptide (TPR) repeat protein